MDSKYLASFRDLEESHWWFRARREIVLDQIRQSSPPADASILDIGAGTGGTLAYLKAEMPRACYCGIEPDRGARECCAGRGFAVAEGSAQELPSATATHDIITALDVLEHVEDDAAAVREIARVLRPGGIAVVTVPAYPWLWGPHDEVNHHIRRYGRSRVERLFSDAGLEIERSTYFNTLLFPLAMVQRMFEKLTRRHRDEERLPSPGLNSALYAVFSWERVLIRRVRFPWGVSILVVARRPLERCLGGAQRN